MIKKLKRYMVVDEYEGRDEIGIFNTLKKANEAVRRQIEDTDGECDCVILAMEYEVDTNEQ